MGIGKYFESSSGKVNEPKKGRNQGRCPCCQCQYSGSSQILSQVDANNFHQNLSLYKVVWNDNKTQLIIYDTENGKEGVKVLDTELKLDSSTSITQLPNCELFCYGSLTSGITLIIDRSYRVRVLRFGIRCCYLYTVYFDDNIYCFGGGEDGGTLELSRKFELKNNRWINLPKLPKADYLCHCVIFNRNILISGYYSRNLWLYSTEIDSFSIIPYDFSSTRKLLINTERLYLIEWNNYGLIYESEDEYGWKLISKSGQSIYPYNQIYCLYNREKICISSGYYYYQFDLKEKVVRIIAQTNNFL